MRRTGVWVSASRNSIIHEIFSEFLQPFRYVGTNGSPRSKSWSSFLFGFWFSGWLGQQVSTFFPFNMFTWRRLLDRNLSHTGLEGVMVVEEGKLEEELADKPGITIWRILEDFHSQEYIQFFDIHCGLFMRLHFSTGCYDCRWTSRRR